MIRLQEGLVRLKLVQFRCYEELVLELGAQSHFFLGENGGGKTTILEAIYLLSRLRSYRTAQTRELVQWTCDGFRIEAVHQGRSGEETVAMQWKPSGRELWIGPTRIEKVEEFWGQIPTVLWSSEDTQLIRGPAVRRQNWLDSLLAYQDRNYLRVAQRYHAILKQRNAWLRQGAQDSALGKILTQQLEESGQKITCARQNLAERLSEKVVTLAQPFFTKNQDLHYIYQPSFSPVTSPDWSCVQAGEIRLGRTLLGPHRDELVIRWKGKSVARFGSEGEQRLAALLLRLLETEFIHERRGVWPVLLLDDIFTPLDPVRRGQWQELLPSAAQRFIAATERPPAQTGETVTWHVAHGKVSPQ